MADVLIVAGEPSGDELGAELVAAARNLRPDLRFFGATGPSLEAAGATRIVATRELAVMGLTEVVGRLPTAWRALGRLAAAAEERRPVGALLIDAPDFNLRLARRLARRGIPVVQYVSPTIWAWRPGRIARLQRDVRRLLLTLPFEADVYAGTGVDAVYVGNPVLDRVPANLPPRAAVAERLGLDAGAPWVALLPGSRIGELERMGPLLGRAAARVRDAFPQVQLLAAVATGLEPGAVRAALGEGPPARLVEVDRFAALGHSAAAIAVSGTVSLELAVLGVPHVVCYRVSAPTYALARLVVRVRHIALPNLIAGRTVVPELVQAAARPETVAAPVLTWLGDEAARRAVAEGLASVRDALGPPGAAARAARAALEAWNLALV